MGVWSSDRARYLAVVVVVLIWVQGAHLSLTDQEWIQGVAGSLPRLALVASARGLVVALIAIVLLRLSREGPSDVGFTSMRLGRQLGIGTLFGFALFVAHQLLIAPIVGAFLPASAPQGIDLAPLFADVTQYPIWFFLAVFKGGLIEEGMRVFGLTRFEKVFGRPGLVFAVIAGSIVFGINHLYQGVDSAIGTGIQAVLFVLIYLRRRRTLEAVTAHAVYDLVGITIAYWIY